MMGAVRLALRGEHTSEHQPGEAGAIGERNATLRGLRNRQRLARISFRGGELALAQIQLGARQKS